MQSRQAVLKILLYTNYILLYRIIREFDATNTYEDVHKNFSNGKNMVIVSFVVLQVRSELNNIQELVDCERQTIGLQQETKTRSAAQGVCVQEKYDGIHV